MGEESNKRPIEVDSEEMNTTQDKSPRMHQEEIALIFYTFLEKSIMLDLKMRLRTEILSVSWTKFVAKLFDSLPVWYRKSLVAMECFQFSQRMSRLHGYCDEIKEQPT
ncbi:hypothetical protein Glove_141g25 [Diversispora epigaea]|uniref:Uncharacterized protein n=1 Tax=Diversispora epigaea TaxID=1348612 RepID=A0A397IUZ6_9GLOM|nr:hypothetical protein Glove_141g25 [Diversispora epigaea]